MLRATISVDVAFIVSELIVRDGSGCVLCREFMLPIDDLLVHLNIGELVGLLRRQRCKQRFEDLFQSTGDCRSHDELIIAWFTGLTHGKKPALALLEAEEPPFIPPC